MTVDLKNHGLLVSLIALPFFFAVISFTHAKANHHHKSASKTGAIVGGTVGGVAVVGGAAASASGASSSQSASTSTAVKVLEKANQSRRVQTNSFGKVKSNETKSTGETMKRFLSGADTVVDDATKLDDV